MLCLRCGNEIEAGVEECPVCVANSERGAFVEAEPDLCRDCGHEPDGCVCEVPADGTRMMLCPGCGNEVEVGVECPVCADSRERRRAQRRDDERQLCLSCGNEILGSEPCPVCNAGRAIRKRRDRDDVLVFCPGCGHEVEDANQCPICNSGHAIRRKRDDSLSREPLCPLCDELLQEQDWDGVKVFMCDECNGCFFFADGLERTLDKLRAEAETPDLATVLAEFRDRHRRALPKSVRYKPCPICGMSMMRRNYQRVSGIIVDICGTHGMWTDQAAFGELTDFVTRGGDALASRDTRRRR